MAQAQYVFVCDGCGYQTHNFNLLGRISAFLDMQKHILLNGHNGYHEASNVDAEIGTPFSKQAAERDFSGGRAADVEDISSLPQIWSSSGGKERGGGGLVG